MEVKIIKNSIDSLDLVYVAAKTCYGKKTPKQLASEVGTKTTRDKLAFIKSIVKAGHYSVLEHYNITVMIEGVSRSLLAQLSRHRHISMSVQQQRTNADLSNFEYIMPSSIKNGSHRYVTDYVIAMDKIKVAYNSLIAVGIPQEDARMLLPNACTTNIVMTVNLRTLIEICHKRLCFKAQWEIRELFSNIKYFLLEQWFYPYLQPKCFLTHECNEIKPCGNNPWRMDDE